MIGLLAQSPILIDWNVAARLSGTGLVKEKLQCEFSKSNLLGLVKEKLRCEFSKSSLLVFFKFFFPSW